MELLIKPREYQEKILETCKKENCLVILPTGTGKTLIALMLAIDRFKQFPLKKVLFLAPTRPLAEQHLNYFKQNLPDCWANLQLFIGKTPPEERMKIWQTAEFIFSTPQCIANDLKNNLYDLKEVSLLIEDECHRCLKNYSYNFIAQKYKETNGRILGLTASPGSDKQTITKVCENLGISAVEIRTRESEDVKPYLQELQFKKIEVDFPAEFEKIRQLLREIYNKKILELRNRKVLFHNPSKSELLQLQSRLFKQLIHDKNPNAMMSVSVSAQAIKLQHALELLETQTIFSFRIYMKDLYKQAQEKKSKGVQRLVNDARFAKAYTLASTILGEHPKIEKIRQLAKETIQNNPNAKIIIFAQYRETVKMISELLNKIPNIRASNFIGQAGQGMNQKKQKQIIQDFSEGKINCLVATSIAEEGLDIPEVNEVIFYEPVPSAIRKIQRTGRTARLFPGALKILITKNTRDQAYHYASTAREKKMHQAIAEIQEDIETKNIKAEQKTLEL